MLKIVTWITIRTMWRSLFPTNSSPVTTPVPTRPFDPVRVQMARARLNGSAALPASAEAHYQGMDAMQLSKRLSNDTVSALPLGRKAMSAKVLSLSCEAIRASVRVEPDVIEILEDFLDEARRGETIAGAIVLVRPNATICSAISAPHGGRHHLVAACNYLKQDIITETDN